MQRLAGQPARGDRFSASRGRWLLILVLGVVPTGLRAQGEEQVFALVDPTRVSSAGGTVVFCPPDTACLEFLIDDFDGRFAVPMGDLVPGDSYSVVYRPADDGPPSVNSNWVFEPLTNVAPTDEPTGFPAEIQVYTFVVAPDRSLVFRIDRGGLAEVDRYAGEPVPLGPVRWPTPPGWRFALGTTLILGGEFKPTSGSPLAVQSVAPGLTLGVARRWFAVPGDDNLRWRRYLSVGAAYAGNRYQTGLNAQPGSTSDVTFHRGQVGVGVGWVTAQGRLDVHVGALLAFGGIFDGSTLIKYAGRSYSLFGIGGQVSVAYLLALGARTVGPVVSLGYAHYPADHGEPDFWYGGLPTLALGVAVH